LGKKGGSSGLKRKPAPRFWPIHRKEFTWVVRPSPGPHSLQACLPLAVVLRDILGFAKTRKEAKTIISQGKVFVDGKIRYEDSFPVGLMDVISIPDADKDFRVLPSKKGLILYPIGKEEATFKLCRIENKTIVKNGHVQVNLNDGSNILLKATEENTLGKDVYDPLDTVKVSLPERQIIGHVKMREKALAIITGGKNIGKYGKILEIEKAKTKKLRNAFVTIEDAKGNRFQTILKFVFAVGETQPLISIPEEASDAV